MLGRYCVFDADTEVLVEALRNEGGLPAGSRALVERVGGAGRTERLDDVLHSFSGNARDAVVFSRENHSSVNGNGGRSGGSVRSHYESNVIHGADFALHSTAR